MEEKMEKESLEKELKVLLEKTLRLENDLQLFMVKN